MQIEWIECVVHPIVAVVILIQAFKTTLNFSTNLKVSRAQLQVSKAMQFLVKNVSKDGLIFKGVVLTMVIFKKE